MKKVMLLLLILFVVCGCEVSQDASMKSTGVEKESAIEEDALIDEEPKIALEETRDEVILETPIKEEVKVEALVLSEEKEEVITESSEEIIKQNRWGFSIFNPETAIVKYYTSAGVYLGKKTI